MEKPRPVTGDRCDEVVMRGMMLMSRGLWKMMWCRGMYDGDEVDGMVMMWRERGGDYLLLLRGLSARMGPRNPVSSGVTPRMRTSSSSSSGIGSGRSTTLR